MKKALIRYKETPAGYLSETDEGYSQLSGYGATTFLSRRATGLISCLKMKT